VDHRAARIKLAFAPTRTRTLKVEGVPTTAACLDAIQDIDLNLIRHLRKMVTPKLH
jgi:hypothetical protein